MGRFSNWFPKVCALSVFALAACHAGGVNTGGSGVLPVVEPASLSAPHHYHVIAFNKARKPIAKSAGQNVYALFELELSGSTAWIYGASAVAGNASPLAQIGVKTPKLATFVYVDARGRVYELMDPKTSAVILVGYKSAKGATQDLYGDMCLKGQIIAKFTELTNKSGVTAETATRTRGKCPTSIAGAVAIGQNDVSAHAKSTPTKQNLAFYSCMMGATLFRSAADKFYLMAGQANGTVAGELHATGDLHAAQAQVFAGLCNDPAQIALGTQAAPKCPPDCVYAAPPVPLVAAAAYCPATKVIDITFNAPQQNCTATLSGNPGATFTAKTANSSIVTVSPTSGTLDGSGKVTLTFVAQNSGGQTSVTANSGQTNLVFDVTNAWTTSAPATITALTFQLENATLAIGQTMSVAVSAQSADGQTIQGTYDHPITLTAKNLVLSSSSVTTSAQASALTASWKSGYTGSGTGSITASADGKTATVTVQPGSGFAFYNVGTNPNTDVTGFQMTLGPDGNVYYGTQGPLTCVSGFCYSTDGAVGQFNPGSGTATEIELHSPTVGLFFSSDGALWIAGDTSHNLFRVAPNSFTSSALTTIAVPTPSTGSNYYIRNMTQDGSNNLWFTDGRGGRVFKLPLSGPFTTAALTPYPLPSPPNIQNVPENPPWAGGVAYDGAASSGVSFTPGIFIADFFNGIILDVNPSNGSTQTYFAGPQQNAAGSSYTVEPRFVTLFNGSQIAYTGAGKTPITGSSASGPSNGYVDRIDPTKNVAAQPAYNIPAAPSGRQPDSIGSNGSDIYYADLYGGLGYIDGNTSLVREYPIVPVSSLTSTTTVNRTPNGIAVMPDGTAWFTCAGSSSTYLGPLCLGHTVYTNAWSLWPGPSVTIVGFGATNSQPVGVMEAPSANSGPFTAAVDNSAVCSVTLATNPSNYYTPAPDHNFYVTGLASGTCTVTIYDANKKHSSQLHVTVQASAAKPRAPSSKMH